MENRAALASSSKATEHFRKGQVWKVGEVKLAVTAVGKTLVHYKRYVRQPKGVRTTLSSKGDLKKYLRSTKAVLLEG